MALLIAKTSLTSQSEHEYNGERQLAEKKEDSNEHAPLDLEEFQDDLNNSNLPILPPLILLDFTNGTNLTTDGKVKRTIDGNLGYGIQGNNILSGKYNYYFPGGKSGTTVSIEESLSPFLPKTIIETVKSGKKVSGNSDNQYNGNRREKEFFSKTINGLNGDKNPQLTSSRGLQGHNPTVFGQRTKLQKTTADFGTYRDHSTAATRLFNPYTTASYSTYSTTPQPTYQQTFKPLGLNYVSSTTEKPVKEEPSTPGPLSFFTPAAYRENYLNRYSQRTVLEPTQASKRPILPADPYYKSFQGLGDYPRYSFENGVKYEHKIVWKYPDGRIVDTPPASSADSYLEYPSPQNTAHLNNFQNLRYNTRPVNFENIQKTNLNLDPSSIYSQRPAQFPQENLGNQNDQKVQNQFISSSSFPGSNYNTGSSDSSSIPYETIYQNPYNSEGNIRTGFQGFSAYNPGTLGSQRISYNPLKSARPVPKYAVNSPNPNYVGTAQLSMRTTSSDTSSSLFTPTGQISQNVLSRYTPDAQQYLKKVFGSGKTSGKSSFGSDNVQPQYADLLKYNPSISQYIKNPSSILNAQPTFVQAGNSLIPVIILRVDGTPPVQSKEAPNINLKALLQQYLTQYAQSLSDMSQDSNFDLGNDYITRSQTSGVSNPISDLTKLTQSLSLYAQNPSSYTNFKNQFTQSNEFDGRKYETSGNYPISKHGQKQQEREEERIVETVSRYTSQGRKSPKVKNVEIIEDPRYTSYSQE